MTWFKRKDTTLRNPKGYYRSGLTADDFRLAMESAGPLHVHQIAALLADKIPPEAKARHWQLYEMGHSGGRKTRESQLFYGAIRIVHFRIRQLKDAGKVLKHGSGKDAKYEWVEIKNDSPGKNTPRRRHAKSKGTRRGRN